MNNDKDLNLHSMTKLSGCFATDFIRTSSKKITDLIGFVFLIMHSAYTLTKKHFKVSVRNLTG